MSAEPPDLDSELSWARVEESVTSRRRRRDEADLLAMESTLGSVLAGAAVGRTQITVATTDGRRFRGAVVASGAELVLIEHQLQQDATGRITALRTSSITRLELDPSVNASLSTPQPLDTTMLEHVAGFAGTRLIVSVGLAGGEIVVGEVEWCGEDVAAIRGRDGGVVTVIYLASVNEVTSTSTSSA